MFERSSFMTKPLLLFAAALAAALAPALAKAEGELNVFNWSDYIGETTIEDFQKETGIKTRYDVYDSNDILETKLLAGKTGYDVVVPTGSFLARQIQAGVFMKLDKAKLPNLKNLDPAIMARVDRNWDPGNQYAIPHMWGTTGVGYNVDKIKQRMADAPVDSLRMLFDPAVVAKFADCGIHVLDAPDELIPAALKYLGLDPNSHDAKVIEQAEAVLMAMRPHVAKFHSSEYINALANGDICLAFGWSGDMFQAHDRAAEAGNNVVIDYRIPKEGALLWVDMMAIPADAPNADNAHVFLDYMMRPEVIAAATNYVQYANGNAASKSLIDPEITGNPSIYPTPEVIENLYLITPQAPREQRLMTRLWTRVKSGQ